MQFANSGSPAGTLCAENRKHAEITYRSRTLRRLLFCFTQGALRLKFLRVVFHDELVAAGDALALKLGEFGPFRPIHDSTSPYTDLLNEWTRVAQGNYVREGQCFDPPSPALAMRALNPDAVSAEIGIRCEEKCVLTVRLRDAETKAQGRDYLERVRS